MKYFGKDNAYVCYDGNDAKLAKKIDDCFFKIIEKYDCEEYVIPALIDSNILRKCGSFESFPQHITYCSVNRNNNEIKGSYERQDSGFCLTPAACLHFYPMLEGKIVDKKCITTKAKVYRYENYKYDQVSRFWDFTVREVVFVGNKEYVQECIERISKEILEFSKTVNLNVRIDEASDSFYPSVKNAVKMKMQVKNKLKKEFITQIDGKEIALGSINIHGNHFSKVFDFDNKNTIVSACVGLGIERWVNAVEYNKLERNIMNME